MKTLRILTLAAFTLSAFTVPLPAQSEEELGADAVMLFQQKKYQEAVPIARKLVALRKTRENQNPKEYAFSLTFLAGLYERVGELGKAEPLYQRALAITGKVLGPEDPDTVAIINLLAMLYDEMHDLGKAEPLYQRALAITGKTLGPEHPETAACLNRLAALHKKTGDFGKAEPLYQRALAITEKALGPEHSDTVASINLLATLYMAMGEFGKAEPFYQRALAITEKAAGPEHPKTATSLSQLALLYHSVGAYVKAVSLYSRVKEIRAKSLGTNHPDYAKILNNLGGVYYSMGDYAKAEALLVQAKEIRAKTLGDEHPDYANSLFNLAGLYQSMGDYAKAMPLYVRAAEIQSKGPGGEPQVYAMSLNNMANLCHSMGDYAHAEPLYVKAMEIQAKVLGVKHQDYARSLNNLACLYQSMGAYAKAEPLYMRANDIIAQALGVMHPDYATFLRNLGHFYHATGDDAKAELLYMQAKEIVAKVLGVEHHDYATGLKLLSFNQLALNKHQAALGCATEAETRYRTLWGKLLSFSSESQRNAVIERVGSLDLCGAIGHGPLAASSLLWRKGALLDSLVEERRLARAASSDKELAARFAAAENLKGILRQAIMEGNKAKLGEAKITKYQTELEVLQKAMALKVGGLGGARRSLECSVEQVQAAIPKGAVLVDFMRYDHALGKKTSERRYAAVLVMPDHAPVFVALGKADAIDAALARHRKAAGSRPESGDAAARARDAELEAACKDLHALIGTPVETALPPATTELIICPDGQLHFLAFASLMDQDGKLWAEKFTLRNISTARDLLKLPRSRASDANKTVVLVGNPDFRDSTPLALVAEAEDEDARDKDARQRLAFNLTRGGQNDELRGLNFGPLQGTATEVAGLRIRFERQGWKTQILTGQKASEPAVVAAVNGPDILHLATHGFFVDELDLGQKMAREPQTMNGGMGGDDMRLRGAARDPMLRSGLALSGAQSTCGLWANGKVPPLDKDGILTAAEVVSLRLHATQLVTLSACQTGLGESKSGEGVLGLQRSIALAGAENLLMTLWNISDEDTVALMAAFYDRVLAGEHPARALPAVQRDALIRLRKEKGLWYAVNRAAPFVIVSNTAVPAIVK